MRYYTIEPEVAGGLGKETELDNSTRPPTVRRLNYEFYGWLGDPILESYPVYIVTRLFQEKITALRLTGVTFDNVLVTLSDQFRELYPGRSVGDFAWLKPSGEAGRDDFGMASDGRLVISDNVKVLLQSLETKNAILEPFAAD